MKLSNYTSPWQQKMFKKLLPMAVCKIDNDLNKTCCACLECIHVYKGHFLGGISNSQELIWGIGFLDRVQLV